MEEYNNFLEEVEDIVYNLVEGIDVEATEARVTKYRRGNEDQIAATQARKMEEERMSSMNANGTGHDTEAGPMGQQISSTIYIGAPTDLNNPEMMKERLELEMYASGYAIEWVELRATKEAMECMF
eukprot:CAMPEP_0114248902 /NCGR_PEP_ID=MMETSP0058-20121206/13831_1 /TAXON_ID=36894 /ORGANISM="Pyramimonas parkeae, CCMP726" /LENGTH=125 /DNA_ID=CAMNT_0001362361 /DNA_START=368 /DNA_END=745 /DNA_ORIENTATION=+